MPSKDRTNFCQHLATSAYHYLRHSHPDPVSRCFPIFMYFKVRRDRKKKEYPEKALTGDRTSARPAGRPPHVAKSRARRPASEAHKKVTRGGAEVRKETPCRKKCAARRPYHHWTSQRVSHISSDSIKCASLRRKRVEGCGTARAPEDAVGAGRETGMRRMIED